MVEAYDDVFTYRADEMQRFEQFLIREFELNHD